MSLLSDKKLIEELIRLGQAAQPAAPQPTTPDPNKIKELALKLMGNLDTEINHPQETFSSDRGSSNPRMNNLQSLEQFLYFLNHNLVQYNGSPLVLRKGAELNGATASQYVKYPEPQTDEGTDYQYLINKDALVAYVQYLQEQAAGEKNQLKQAVIGRLADHIRDEVGIDTTKPAPDTSNAVLDTVPAVLNPASPNGAGTVPVTAANLADKNSFDSWASSNLKLLLATGPTAYGDLPDNQICTVIGALYQRAEHKNLRRNDPLAKQYIALVARLSSEFQCTIPAGGNGAGQNQNSAYHTAGYVSSNGALTDQGVAKLQGGIELPLVPNVIVIDRIEKFTEGFKNLTQASITTEVQSSLDKLKSNYPNITSLNLTTMSFAQLDTFITSMHSRGNGYDFIDTMNDLLPATYQMLQILSRMLDLSGSPRAMSFKEAVDQQTQAIYVNNISGLNRLSSEKSSSLPGNRR